MQTLVVFFSFSFGLLFGSFLNVVADRLYIGKSFLKGRSVCDHCKHVLAWYDLFPLFSYLFLSGKCRYCKKRLSIFYPASELLTATAFAITAYTLFSSSIAFTPAFFLSLGTYFVIVSVLLVVFFADSKYGIIPLGPLIVGMVAALLLLFFKVNIPPLSTVFSAIGAFAFLFLLTLIRIKGKTAMGIGDAIFALFMGFLLGFPGVIVGMYIAFLTGALYAAILILRGKKKMQGSTIPFGPFLVLGTYIALFWSDKIIWYALRFLVR